MSQRLPGREAWIVGALVGLREQAGETQRELAIRLDVSHTTVSYWERGARRIRLADAIRWAALYGHTLQVGKPGGST